MPDFLSVCEQAARAGGAALLDWVERFSVREKGPADLVTEADVASQEAVRRVVLDAFPDHDFLSEEEAPAVKTGRSETSLSMDRRSAGWDDELCSPDPRICRVFGLGTGRRSGGRNGV